MEMEEKHNPDSRKRRSLSLNSWSDLPLDLLNSVFERLGFTDFQRAKSVCSSWHSASRQCVPESKQIHWLILFPKDNDRNNNYSCRLFNPEEKDKLYKTQDLGLEFARSVCMKTYGSWLLMRDPLNNLYIVNLFTQERINLPPTESQLGKTKLVRGYYGLDIRSPVFWIDEKTKDHLVFWGLGSYCVVYTKKEDNPWFQIHETSGCCDMVYKDHKLYFLSDCDKFKIFDFSGEIPQQTFQCSVIVKTVTRKLRDHATKLVVTVTGEVLKVEKGLTLLFKKWVFRVFKVCCSSGFHKKYELINSLGDESMLLDQGITVLANDTDGFIRNSIYFSATHADNTDGIFRFNLETGETERLHKFDPSTVQLSSAQWFLPSFRHT